MILIQCDSKPADRLTLGGDDENHISTVQHAAKTDPTAEPKPTPTAVTDASSTPSLASLCFRIVGALAAVSSLGVFGLFFLRSSAAQVQFSQIIAGGFGSLVAGAAESVSKKP